MIKDKTTTSNNQDRQNTIINMFDDIAKTYDIANIILSGGIDRIWRRSSIKKALSRYKDSKTSDEVINILDVACGSGDMIEQWQILSKKQNLSAKLQGFDASANMLKIAKQKFKDVEFTLGDCATLPYKSNSFDFVSISYGIRNVVAIDDAISEFYRVLKPNGSLLILEFMHNENPSLKDKILGIYINKIMPFFGGLISNNKKAYSYLSSSIAKFITKEEMNAKLKKAKFVDIYTNGGILNISTTFIASK